MKLHTSKLIELKEAKRISLLIYTLSLKSSSLTLSHLLFSNLLSQSYNLSR